jgi:hypothetical protein
MTGSAGQEEGWELVRVLPEGTVVLRRSGVEQEVEIKGIELSQPPAPLYFEILERIARLAKPLRCRSCYRTADGRVAADLEYFAWHDKSGEVWEDLRDLLVEEGAAQPTSPGNEAGEKGGSPA